MDKLTESVADIIDEMRTRASRREISSEVYGLADRIEAAREREVKEWNALRVKVADFENTKERLAKTQAALERANRYGMQADEENGKLRDLVKRLLPIIENGYDEAKAYGKAVKAHCILKDVDPGEVDKVLKGWEDLIHEAKEVAG